MHERQQRHVGRAGYGRGGREGQVVGRVHDGEHTAINVLLVDKAYAQNGVWGLGFRVRIREGEQGGALMRGETADRAFRGRRNLVTHRYQQMRRGGGKTIPPFFPCAQ